VSTWVISTTKARRTRSYTKAAANKSSRQGREFSGSIFAPLHVLRTFAVEISCLLALLSTAEAATIDVGPEAAPGIRAIASLNASQLGPGTVIRLHAGIYTAPIVIPLTGTKAAPIIIEGANDGAIDLEGSVVLDHAAFVIVRRLHIENATDAGIILRHGSHDNKVILNVIERARLGIWLGDGVGEGNHIVENTIRLSATHGIALDSVTGEPGRETVIDMNSIVDSGIHGMEINAHYTAISNNSVSGSGRLSTGASGIHIYARSASDGFGRHNKIDNNRSYENHDASAQDGNGIQLDQWCDDNIVRDNSVMKNDGAGISVFDAARAEIIGNRTDENMRDPGHSHRHKGELVFASDDEHHVDNTRDALVKSNIVVAGGTTVAAILVDVPTSHHPPHFGDNEISDQAGGPIARWAGHDVTSIAAWNFLAPHEAADRVSNLDPGYLTAPHAVFIPGPEVTPLPTNSGSVPGHPPPP
jgi:hypothetical protein